MQNNVRRVGCVHTTYTARYDWHTGLTEAGIIEFLSVFVWSAPRRFSIYGLYKYQMGYHCMQNYISHHVVMISPNTHHLPAPLLYTLPHTNIPVAFPPGPQTCEP